MRWEKATETNVFLTQGEQTVGGAGAVGGAGDWHCVDCRTSFPSNIWVRIQDCPPSPLPNGRVPGLAQPPPSRVGSGFGSLSTATLEALESPKTPPRQPKYGAAAKTLVECSCMYSLSSDQPKYVAPEIWNRNSALRPEFLFKFSRLLGV